MRIVVLSMHSRSLEDKIEQRSSVDLCNLFLRIAFLGSQGGIGHCRSERTSLAQERAPSICYDSAKHAANVSLLSRIDLVVA